MVSRLRGNDSSGVGGQFRKLTDLCDCVFRKRASSILRSSVVDKKPEVKLSVEVECDGVYIVAGHKGNPNAIKKRVG